jgi:hypothetical protein
MTRDQTLVEEHSGGAGDDAFVEEAGVFGALFDVYREQGFERGYERAVQDMLGSLVTVTEKYLRAHPTGAPALRRQLYAYVEFLERQLESAARETGYVSGGLGI